jgi:uncharacterized protein
MINKDTLREVIILQRDSLDKLSVGVKRENKIKVHSSFAVIITGIRRAGKSTLLHQILKESKLGYYLNLEDPRLEGFDLSDFNKIESLMIFLMKFKM